MIPFYQHQNPVWTPIQNANFITNWDYVTTQMWLKTAENLVKNVLNPKSFRILVLKQSKFHTSYINSFYFFLSFIYFAINQITNIQLQKHINLVLGESICKVSMWHEHGYGKEADIEAVEGKREYRGLMNLKKGHFRLTCVAQKRCCLSFLLYGINNGCRLACEKSRLSLLLAAIGTFRHGEEREESAVFAS